MLLTELKGQKLALLGAGREAKAVRAVLAEQLPALGVDILCEQEPGDSTSLLLLPNDRLIVGPLADAGLEKYTVLIKSPGISPYRNEIQTAIAAGAKLTSGTNLWFAQNQQANTICITGTKGKSTTSALLSHLLRALGQSTELAGNIGIPLMERWGQQADHWVIEMSSFQAADFNAQADISVLVSLFAEHLDWHGNEQRYIDDKLNLLRKSSLAVVNAADPRLLEITADLPNRLLFNHSEGWQQRGGDIWLADELIRKSQHLPLRGHHNASNLCAALTLIDLLGLDAKASLQALPDFVNLPHRLQSLGCLNGQEWINDSIATTPAAVVAAVAAMPAKTPLILLLGGYDRGVDWQLFVDFLQTEFKHHANYPVTAILGLPDNGSRILAELTAAGIELQAGMQQTASLKQAVAIAKNLVPGEAIILLSPGAPSFSEFENFEQRGEMFKHFAGFH